MKILKNQKGEGYIDTGVKIIIAVIVGALLLSGIYLLFNTVILPKTNNKIESMMNTGNLIQVKAESGKVSYSYDGASWKDSSITATHPSDIVTKMIVIGEGENRVWLVTTYDSVNTYGRLYTSRDGTEWIPTNADDTGHVTITQYSSGRIYLNCDDSRQYYTYDGVNWTMTSTKRY